MYVPVPPVPVPNDEIVTEVNPARAITDPTTKEPAVTEAMVNVVPD